MAWAEGIPGEQATLLQRGLDVLPPGALGRPDRELARELETVRARLARAKEEMGDFDGAARAIEEKLRASRLSAVDDAIDLVHLAELRTSQGRLETARSLLQRAVKIAEARCEPTDLRRGRWVAALARLDERTGHPDEAQSGFHQARELLKKAYPPPLPEELHELDAALARTATTP